MLWSASVGFVLVSIDAYPRVRGMLDRGELATWQPAAEPGMSERRGTVKWLLRYIDYVQIQHPDGFKEITVLQTRRRWGMAALVFSAGCTALIACYILWRWSVARWKAAAAGRVHVVG